ncbi:MAG TPA: hypothetical protein VHM91_25505 [Verrucomicrobiales bacterium]|jgi:hypothetical protein|nr:hypothetical protein [Verrucomicrobiales bacterium]
MELPCGCRHQTVEEALDHAFKNIGRPLTEPLIGTKTNRLANSGKVIGFQTSDKKSRVRLDFTDQPDKAGVIKGLHVNEEDFSGPSARKILHTVELVATPANEEAHKALLRWQENRMLLYWNKWSKRL